MIVEGLQKLTLLDYPEKIACTVFTHGCNFRCPFCHNASLVMRDDNQRITQQQLDEFFTKRKGILDGVCITGGEPLLQKDIKEFIENVRTYGYLVKLDTNGSNPEKLSELINEGLLDYVAMDIKSSPEKYAPTVGVDNFDVEPVKKSVEILKKGSVPYEFRTTVVRELHSKEDFRAIGEWLSGCEKYFLQQFVDSGDVICDGMSAYSAEEMSEIKDVVAEYIPSVELRGV